jgi:hypothetical protein
MNTEEYKQIIMTKHPFDSDFWKNHLQPEFSYLAIRQEKAEKYLKKVRSEIDPRISDNDIMTGYDYGIDVVAKASEVIAEYEKNKK